MGFVHFRLHLVEGGLGLLEEAKDYGLGEVSIVLLIHIKNLSKGWLVDMVAEVKIDLSGRQSAAATFLVGRRPK